jgi:hypothetical protein
VHGWVSTLVHTHLHALTLAGDVYAVALLCDACRSAPRVRAAGSELAALCTIMSVRLFRLRRSIWMETIWEDGLAAAVELSMRANAASPDPIQRATQGRTQ